ncbi:MAG: hypothetical protein AVDCRST_MAG77-1585 [uncultured Chloroflexi bacterium]|uniref:ASCH domain-containing protein n=1 Tax=uncultured Chloroflexota bacterium TaxID=166587 RepID=A0A6J4I4C9_9CHLR|nr:MAG: hypothetical protein AVDCRST_MAG77-1585 [uncultured Chloroflexota bacterium]
MPHLVFGWTTPALLAGAKSVHRLPSTDRSVRHWHAGMLISAYQRAPARGGRPVAVVQLTEDPSLEPLPSMPDDDYDAEGWRWLHEHRSMLPAWITSSDFGIDAFRQWRARPASLWVVRFRLVAAAVADQATEALAVARAA